MEGPNHLAGAEKKQEIPGSTDGNDHGKSPVFTKTLGKRTLDARLEWLLQRGRNSSKLLASSFFKFFLSCSASTDLNPKLTIVLSVPGYITPRSMVANQLFRLRCNRVFRLHLGFRVHFIDVSRSMETYSRFRKR